MKNERGIEEEYCLLCDRALEHLWFKSNDEYEGVKYSQNELRSLLGKNTTPDLLCACIEHMNASKEPLRSPVAYLGKCILGALIKGIAPIKKKPQDDGSTFDIEDFFAAALKRSYE